MISLDDANQSITIKDLVGLNSLSLNLPLGFTRLTGAAFVTLEAPLIRHGPAAVHPAVLGDQLLTYLNLIVGMFNTHVHPGEATGPGGGPVTPAPPLPQLPLATPNLLSIKNLIE